LNRFLKFELNGRPSDQQATKPSQGSIQQNKYNSLIIKEPVPEREARLPKWLRGSLEVRVVKTAWVQIPHLAKHSEDVRVVKETVSRSVGASRMGSNPILRKEF
jgi:hypothetical protein